MVCKPAVSFTSVLAAVLKTNLSLVCSVLCGPLWISWWYFSPQFLTVGKTVITLYILLMLCEHQQFLPSFLSRKWFLLFLAWCFLKWQLKPYLRFYARCNLILQDVNIIKLKYISSLFTGSIKRSFLKEGNITDPSKLYCSEIILLLCANRNKSCFP